MRREQQEEGRGEECMNLHFKLCVFNIYFSLLFIAKVATRRMLSFLDNWSENKAFII